MLPFSSFFLSSDGLTLPFEQLIKWDDIVVRIEESALDSADPEAILSTLRDLTRDRRKLHRRSALALSTFYTYFDNQRTRVRGLLASIGAVVKFEHGRKN